MKFPYFEELLDYSFLCWYSISINRWDIFQFGQLNRQTGKQPLKWNHLSLIWDSSQDSVENTKCTKSLEAGKWLFLGNVFLLTIKEKILWKRITEQTSVEINCRPNCLRKEPSNSWWVSPSIFYSLNAFYSLIDLKSSNALMRFWAKNLQDKNLRWCTTKKSSCVNTYKEVSF